MISQQKEGACGHHGEQVVVYAAGDAKKHDASHCNPQAQALAGGRAASLVTLNTEEELTVNATRL